MIKPRKQRVIIGISSGIAAYKILDLIPLLQHHDLDVVVMMTSHANQMISAKKFESKTQHQVYVDLYPKTFDYQTVLKTRHVDHIDLADSADLLLIAPATANIVAKLAHGIADDLVTTTSLAVTCPMIICPSMNVHMWHNPAVQENITTLKRRGIYLMEPANGPLACGYDGKGRLPEVTAIAEAVIDQLKQSRALVRKRIVVTAGGTHEKIDNVRYITNRSSGKMGIAIADACAQCGANVTLLRSASSILPRYLMTEQVFESSTDLQALLKAEVPKADIVFHVAAVSDFAVQKTHYGKLSSSQQHSIELVPQNKILDQIKQWNPQVKVIAFKAEHGLPENELITKAKQRLTESNADAIVANDISRSDRGFGVDTNEVIVLQKNGVVQKIPLRSKTMIAKELIKILL